MKRYLFSILAVSILAACNSKQPAESVSTTTTTMQDVSMPDTTGLAEYKRVKEQQQFVEMNGVQGANPTFTSNDVSANQPAPSRPVVIYRNVPSKRSTVVRSVPQVRHTSSSGGVRTSSDRYGTESSGSSDGTASLPGVSSGTGIGDGPIVASTPAPAPEVKKKGWSKAAKGTVIGAGSGAVLGAVIGKNKVKSAVIGGVVGAAGGYVLGKVLDKKSSQ